MTILKREQLVAEQIIRDYVRKRILKNLNEREVIETKVRKLVRHLIQEAETGTEEPSTYTGINVLADLLKNIIPVLSDDFKMLTTSKEQRESFRNHIIHAVKNTLVPIEVSQDAENLTLDVKESLYEKISIDIGDEETDVGDAEFIDIEAEEAAEEDDEFVKLVDQNETGRNFAADSFKRVEKQIVDAYDMLADDQDRELFYDYLITNLLLYFDKFEAELQNELPAVSTPEYEKEKGDLDLGTEETPLEDEAEEELDLDLDF